MICLGDGSYTNPSLAAAKHNNPIFSEYSLIYITIFKKYYKVGDYCEACAIDGHIDLWYGPSPDPRWLDNTDVPPDLKTKLGLCGTEPGKQISKSVLVDPPDGLEVVRKSSN